MAPVSGTLGTLGTDGAGPPGDGAGKLGVGMLGLLGGSGSLSGAGSLMPRRSSRRLRSLSTSWLPFSIASRRRSIARLRSSSLSSFFLRSSIGPFSGSGALSSGLVASGCLDSLRSDLC